MYLTNLRKARCGHCRDELLQYCLDNPVQYVLTISYSLTPTNHPPLGRLPNPPSTPVKLVAEPSTCCTSRFSAERMSVFCRHGTWFRGSLDFGFGVWDLGLRVRDFLFGAHEVKKAHVSSDIPATHPLLLTSRTLLGNLPLIFFRH